MEIVLQLSGILTAVLVPCFLIYTYVGSKRLSIEELGLKPIYSEQCGGMFDSFNLTVPFVRFAVYDSFIAVAYGRNRFVLPFENIHHFSEERQFFSKGIVFHHNRPGIPVSFIIWSKNPKRLIKEIQNRGIKNAT